MITSPASLLILLTMVAGADDLPRSGGLGAGVNLEPVALGSIQAFGPAGVRAGVSFMAAVQIDLGPRWALRLPIDFSVAGASPGDGYADLGFTPGVLHRWREDADAGVVPYVGGGFKLGIASVGEFLLASPVLAQSTGQLSQGLNRFHHNHHSFAGTSGGSNTEDGDETFRFGAFPEIWLGLELHPSRWFAFDLGLTYVYVRMAGMNVSSLRERIGLRLSI